VKCYIIEAGADVNVDTPYGNPIGRAMGRGDIAAMDLLYEHGARFDLNGSLMLACEAQRPETIKWVLDKGADPNFYHQGWDCTVLMALAQTYTRRDRLSACVNILIEAGAEYEDGPIMDILRGRSDLLEARIAECPDLVRMHFDFDYGDHLTLRDSTLLHIAVEYNVRSCVDVLLKHGADLNARTRVGNNGAGGQTPIFHVIGSNGGRCYSMFEYLLEKGPDLSVKARIQENPKDDGKVMDVMYKGKDHFFEEIRELTPLGYALRYEHEPEWRSAAREVEKLRALRAPA
jgi:ankyrin repeat protein